MRDSFVMWRLTMSYVPAFLVFLFGCTFARNLFVSNLDSVCLKCMCTAMTGCYENLNCSNGFCGPFLVSKDYWEDAGSITLDNSNRDSDGGFKNCVRNYQCASRVVSNYMAIHAYDCNDDDVTDCDDYMRIHIIGPDKCSGSLDSNGWYRKYLDCRPPKAPEDFSLLKK